MTPDLPIGYWPRRRVIGQDACVQRGSYPWLVLVAGVLSVAAGCSSRGSSSVAVTTTTRSAQDAEVSACQTFGQHHGLEYAGIDGLVSGGTARSISLQLRAKGLKATPWDTVSPNELVNACQFVRPVAGNTLPTTRCADGSTVADTTFLHMFVDASGQSSPNLLDPGHKLC